ncbi:uncharacterized protein LOC101845570 [Aplysia californica]|uniref:Metalloendopeptidase n=1 Tax=Aplysia californica TaxID=6500 RepID=A0ABM1VXP1_APLCA|nr:uncharacterized protein LOC101845570 [Aplysia californica]
MRTRLTRHLAFLGVFVVTLCKPGDTQTLPPAIKDSQDARALYGGHVVQDYLPPGHVVADTQGQGHTQVQGHRERRSTKNNTDFLWPNRVPFVFSTDVEMDRHRLKRVMAYIENHVCVTFHDVTGSYQDTPDWLKQHGYGTSVMLNVVQVSGCTAPLGTSRRRSGILEFQPCNNWYTNLHETGHVLDQIHVQANPDRNLYMSVNPEHVSANQAVLNLQVNKSQFINDFYDTSSVMLYEPTDFSINGLEIYFPIRDELFQHENVFGQERVMFMELSKVYKCNERFCHNISVDCSPGYFTLLKGLCHCVCPEGLDPIRNCKEFRKDADPFIRWPKSPFVLFGPECPKRFQPGTLTLEGTFNPQQSLAPGPPWEFKGHVMNIPFCSRTRGRQSNTDSWPDGNYCAIKPRGVECTRGFEEGSFGWQSDGLLNSTGDIGDIDIQGDWLTIRFCCRKTDYQKMPVELPHREPFSLVAYSMGCPEVVGMRMKMTDVTLYSYNTTRSGTHPNSVSWKYGLRFWMCHYTPPTYGCSAESVLDKNTRSATLTTPGYGVAREASRRCFYTFKVPPNSMLRLTFNTYDLHPEDMVLVRRLHMWENPKRLNNDRPPPQILSVFDHLSVEFWTHWDNFTGWGLNFTVELLLPEDSCYDPKTKGEYYKGNKSISEVYEPCLPWAEATSCLDFPFNGTDGIDLLSSGENNECRNPRGELLQPWCYTYVNGTVCKKRYCDVCNYLKPYDVLKNCSARVASNPEFCHEATERYGCFNTCLFDLEEYVDPGPVTCGKPRMPHDGNPVGPLKDTYLQGAKVAVSCSAYKGNEANIYLECTDTGWVGPRAACPGEYMLELSQFI